MQINPNKIIKKGYIKLSEWSRIQYIGIDLTADNNYEILPEQPRALIRLSEEFNLPKNIFAILYPRSTMFRMGFIIQCGVIEPGYKGRPVILIYCPNIKKKITILKGVRLVQAIFYKARSRGLYKGQYQNEGLKINN